MTNNVLILGTLAFGLVISIGMNAALVVYVMRVSKDLSDSVEGLAAAARLLEAELPPPAILTATEVKDGIRAICSDRSKYIEEIKKAVGFVEEKP